MFFPKFLSCVNSCVYSAKLFPFIQRHYFRLFSEIISDYSAKLFPIIRSSNAVECAVQERCSYLYVHVENAVEWNSGYVKIKHLKTLLEDLKITVRLSEWLKRYQWKIELDLLARRFNVDYKSNIKAKILNDTGRNFVWFLIWSHIKSNLRFVW